MRRCLFGDELGRSIAIRDGATIQGFGIDFRMPYRKACKKCFSFEHSTEDCECERLCLKCGSDGHEKADCTEENYYCIHCQGKHASNTCFEARKYYQTVDTEKALSSIRSYRDVITNQGEDEPVNLPWSQIRLCKQRHWDVEEFARRSGGDLVRSKRKRRKKINSSKNKSYAEAFSGKGNKPKVRKRFSEKQKQSDSIMETLEQILDRLTSLEERVSQIERFQKPSTSTTLGEIVTKVGNLERRITNTEQSMDMDSKEEFDFYKQYDDNSTLQSWEEENKDNSFSESQNFDAIKCGNCNQTFDTEEMFSQHNCSSGCFNAPTKAQNITSLANMGQRITCDGCQMYFDSPEEKQMHDYAYHVNQTCPVCECTGYGFVNMKNHVQKAHPEAWPEIEKSLSKSQEGHGTH